ncbi:MAG: lipoyl(octanoyl) transferase LipB [Phycisphaeraceae bacterium]
MTATPDTLTFTDLGRLPYAPALAIQRELHAQVVAGDAPPTVLFVEHDPVITISRRKSAPQHLLASSDTLEQLGVTIEETDRGGDITYHGPGQLVAYPILRLNPLGLNVGRYIRLLEAIIIETVAPFGIKGVRDTCATGVWVPSSAACGLAPDQPLSKLAALGVRVSRGVTLHGLALNVTTNLQHFNLIVPCGLLGRTVTSMHALLGNHTPSMKHVKERMTDVMKQAFTSPASLTD